MTSLLERVRSLAPTRGTFLNLGSVLAAEVCALSGFDWLLVDLEHGAGGEEALVGQILAGAVHDVPVLVRTESAERIRAGHVLDLGAYGVMFPRLERPEEVVEALAHLWYPPSGDRGIAGYNRGRQFGGDGRDPSQVNASVLSVVQIETLQALINVEEIAAIPGVDVLFVGPNDLSASLGIPGQFESSDYLDALHRVSEACRNNHVAAGILATSGEQVEGLNERGYSFVGISSDSSLLRTAARAATRRDEPL
ncbi:MAG: aldolase/citrate lyase family protein [Acidimicrobiales bacterium]|jgi:2-dehydro-3-deoxyglucarate aldolase/4-hydroxy-2-oxoheptanedioate aldolase